MQARTAALGGGLQEVGGAAAALAIHQQRAVLQRAVEQEGVEEQRLRQVDAQRQERIDVQAAHFDILHAARQQRLQRALARGGDALGTDARVVLVLDLQQVGVQLQPFAVLLRAQRHVGRIGRGNGVQQALGVAVQVVVAGRHAGLGVVLVAQVAHAQAGGPRQVQGVGVQLLQLVAAPAQEVGVQRRRGAEQVHQQPAVAAEVADQADVARRLIVTRVAAVVLGRPEQRPQRLGQRVVVVDAGDALHGLAVAQRQALAVDVLQPAGVGAAIAGDGNVRLVRQRAGHGGAPQVFAVELAAGETVDAFQLVEGLRRIGAGAGDELQQRLGIIGGDLLVGQRRAQGGRVRGEGQPALFIDPQGLAFDAVQRLAQQGQMSRLAQQGQATGELLAQL